MTRHLQTLAIAVLISACSTDNRRPELRAMLDDARFTLRQSVSIALDETPGNAERATLVTSEPVFSINVIADRAGTDVRVSPMTAEIVLAESSGAATFDCPDAIPLIEALAIAEAAAGGESIQSVPDDDVTCAFEIQVLVGDALIEVKVAPDGVVLETEPSDEFGGGDD